MKWIIRERPKIDRIVGPRLIKNFVDKEAELSMSTNSRFEKATKLDAIPYDIPGGNTPMKVNILY